MMTRLRTPKQFNARHCIAAAVPLFAATLLFLCCGSIALASDNCTYTVPHGSVSEPGASPIYLGTDFTHKSAAAESTRVAAFTDGQSLDFTINAQQREGVTATQTTNGPGVLNDDNITVYLFPQGSSGFAYTFSANPLGVRYQTSTENSSYSPEWVAKGRTTGDGYELDFHIPLSVVRSGGATAWRVQIARSIVITRTTTIWCAKGLNTDPFSASFAGVFEHVAVADRSRRTAKLPKPRVGIYMLGATDGPRTTSRMGLDFALPITPTASFLGTFHPDYSNVETDQQTIAPSAFPRQYQEVRPFFTQLSGSFNDTLTCLNCPQTLYTVSIPEFSQGYAFEGKQGNLGFAAFDALTSRRSDAAAAADYEYADSGKQVGLRVQNVRVNASDYYGLGPVRDDSTMMSTRYWDRRSNLYVYANKGVDSGTFVADQRQGTYYEYGGGYSSPLVTADLSFQHVGAQFTPVDGFLQLPDVTGYTGAFLRTWNFNWKNFLQDWSIFEFYTNQHNSASQPALLRSQSQLSLDFKHQYTLQLNWNLLAAQTAAGSQSPSGDLAPFDSNGALFGYRLGTSVPTYVSYGGGPYYHGTNGEWQYVATVGITPRLHLGLEADRTWYSPSAIAVRTFGETGGQAWLEKATLDWQFSRIASLDVGARRIKGMLLPNAFQVPAFGQSASCAQAAPGTIIDCSNVSVGFHVLVAHQELYMAYGDPSQLETRPTFIIKVIRYVGAEKGT